MDKQDLTRLTPQVGEGSQVSKGPQEYHRPRLVEVGTLREVQGHGCNRRDFGGGYLR